MNEDTYRDKLTDLQLEVEELRAKLKEAQTGDLISRQAALDALMGAFCDTMIESICKDTIEALPSAHCDYCPYPDDYDGRVAVVRCKDCKYYGYNECFHGRGLTVAFDNTFCSNAERRTDETP